MKTCRIVCVSVLSFMLFLTMSSLVTAAPPSSVINLPNLISSQPAPDNPASPPGRDAPLWNEGEGPESGRLPVIRKIHDGVFSIGNITIDKNENKITVPGEVNMDDGLVEYLACGPRGKLHESVLKLDVEPFDLQIALLLLGLEPGENTLQSQGGPEMPKGDPVEIWVVWDGQDKYKRIEHRAEELIFNKATNKTMPTTQWLFTGSQVMGNQFMAQVEHSIAATYRDPIAILNHSLPEGTDDTMLFANAKVLPPKGTPITFIIKSIKKEQKP